MVQPVNHAKMNHLTVKMTTTTEPTSEPTTEETTKPRGKAIGHMAKDYLAGMENVEGLPKNAQGIVASSYARGLSPEAFLNISEPADPVVDDGVGDPPPADEGTAGTAPADEPLLAGDGTTEPETPPIIDPEPLPPVVTDDGATDPETPPAVVVADDGETELPAPEVDASLDADAAALELLEAIASGDEPTA